MVGRLAALILAGMGAVAFSGVEFRTASCRTLQFSLLHQDAPLLWTIARMHCRTSVDRSGQAAITAARAGSSGTPGALRIANSVGFGWFSGGKGVGRVGGSGPVTTPDCGLFCGYGERGSEAETDSIPAASIFPLPVNPHKTALYGVVTCSPEPPLCIHISSTCHPICTQFTDRGAGGVPCSTTWRGRVVCSGLITRQLMSLRSVV